jgi:hypothetical protein
MSCAGDNWLVPGANPCGGGGGSVNSVNPGTNVTITGPSTDPIVNSSAGVIARPNFSFFVSKTGNDTTGDGSISLPFLTIQKALNVRYTFATSDMYEIFIFAGTYAETINVANTSGSTSITAYTSSPSNGIYTVNIDGSIYFGGGTGANTTFSNIRFPNSAWNNDTQGLSNLYFRNCYFNGSITTASYVLGGSLHLIDCTIENSGVSQVINASGTYLYIRNCQITHDTSAFNTINLQNAPNNVCTALIDIRDSFITSTSTSSNATAQIRFSNNLKSVGNYITRNVFNWTSGTIDNGTNKCCIQYNGSVNGAEILNLTYNLFICEGATFNSPTIYFMQQRVVGAAYFFQVLGANYAGPTARFIEQTGGATYQVVLVPNI